MNDPSENWCDMQPESSDFFDQHEIIFKVKLVQRDSCSMFSIRSSSFGICRKTCTN